MKLGVLQSHLELVASLGDTDRAASDFRLPHWVGVESDEGPISLGHGHEPICRYKKLHNATAKQKRGR